MAKIKKLKENGATIYPATIPEGVVDTNGFTLAELLDELLEVLGGGSRGNMELAFSDLREAIGSEDGNDLSRFVAKVNVFLEDADASDATINRWKEIESFLTGITDTKTLTGLLNDTLASAKSYADTKVSSGTANMVTMSANAAAADRVLTSGGNNKTAKDSGVAIGDLARNTPASTSANGLMSKEDKEKLDTLYTDFSDLTPEVVTMDDYEDDDSPTMGIIVHDRSGGSTKKVKNSGVLLNDLLRKDQFPVATSSALGGIKSAGDVSVDSSGSVTVNNSAFAMQANMANSALRDGAGAQINTTYLKAAAVTDVTDYKEITI